METRVKKFKFVLLAFFMLAAPAQTFAITAADQKAVVNDTTFYEPDTKAPCSTTGASTGTLAGADSRQKIWNWLIAKGLSPIQAAGVMGNMSVESARSWSPTRQQIGSPWPLDGFGLSQWSYSRRDTLVAALQKQPNLYKYYDPQYDGDTQQSAGYVPAGIPVADNDALISFELDFLYQEATGSPVKDTSLGTGATMWDGLKAQTSIINAVVYWEANFEVSADSNVQLDRGVPAQKIYEAYANGTPTTTGSSPVTSSACTSSTPSNASCTSASTPALVKFCSTVLAYAWPTYHAPEYTDMMPAYAAAIATSRYKGSPPGIDCGGFVTTLMIGSGWEPNYNAQNGNTVAQQAWAQTNWQDLGASASINPATLQPGDVAISGEHTFVWVGTIAGFGGKIASASTGSGYLRSAMADNQQDPTQPGYEWYRKK